MILYTSRPLFVSVSFKRSFSFYFGLTSGLTLLRPFATRKTQGKRTRQSDTKSETTLTYQDEEVCLHRESQEVHRILRPGFVKTF